MAQYFWTAEDYAVGDPVTDAFTIFGSPTSALIAEDGAGRKYLEVINNDNNEVEFRFDAVSDSGDVEGFSNYRIVDDGIDASLIVLRSTFGGSFVGYRADWKVKDYRISYMSPGFNALASSSADTPYISDKNVRFSAVGTTLQATFWEEGASEPTTPEFTTTDTNLASGFVGVSFYRPRAVRIYSMGFGTNGDPAPVKALTPEQFYTDFQGTTVGTLPAGFSSVIEDLGVAEIREDLSLPSSRELLIGDGGAYDVGSVTWDIPGLAYNTEVAVKMRLSSTSFRTGAYVKVRSLSVAELTVGWRGGGVEFGASNLSDVYTEFSDLSVTPSRTSWFWFRLRAEGDQVKYRIWADGDTEPLPWTDTATYSELAFDGKAQITSGDMRTDIHVAEWGVGINGADAPTAPLPTGPNTPINPAITNLQATSARLTWDQG